VAVSCGRPGNCDHRPIILKQRSTLRIPNVATQDKELRSVSARDDTRMSARVLVVDDDRGVASLFERLLTREGFVVYVAHDGPSALAAVASHAPDVVLLDILMPEMNGFEIYQRLKRESATRLTPVVMVTALSDRENRIRGLEAGADDFLTKPVDSQELVTRVRSLVRLKHYTDDLDSAASIITMLAVMIEARDGFTEGHCHRMANYATALGRRLGLGADDLRTLHRGGFLHDIGMLAIADSVLRKPGPLDPEEYEIVKSHTVVGDGLCGNLRSLQAVRPIVRHHHERLDGSGYPDGLRGDAVPLLAAIVGIVDVYDAITTQRPYQPARPVDQAIDVLGKETELGWRRRDLVSEFVAIIEGGQLDRFSGEEGASVPSPSLRDE
ncbi:MAG: response regulator, partial [Vicinamibacterales bacterium]